MKVFIKNKLISWGGGSDVTDINGATVYKVKGRVFSIGRKKVMCDPEGNTLYVIRNRWFNPIRHKTYIKDAEGNRVATVYSKAFDLTTLYADTTTGQYTVQGKFFGRSSTIAGERRRARPQVMPFFRFPLEIRRLICTTNSIEGLNRGIRGVVKCSLPCKQKGRKSSLPGVPAFLKLPV